MTAHKLRSDQRDALTWQTTIDDENLLILASRPGDESLACGGLITRCCRRGRAPLVVVLTDGCTLSTSPDCHTPDALAILHERETRAAVQCLGLPAHRLLMAGLFDGAIPVDGPGFDAVIRGITLVMWARDCNVICAPSTHDAVPDQISVNRIAVEVAKRSGVGLVCYEASEGSLALKPQAGRGYWHALDIASELSAKRAAIVAHASRFCDMPRSPVGIQPIELFNLVRSPSSL